MTIIVQPSNFNPSALTVPDVYEIVIPPQSYVSGANSGVAGLVGTASWGPINKPTLIGDTNGLNSNFGPVSAASTGDLFDLASDVVLALNQAGQLGLTLWCVRVGDGTQASATNILKDTTPTTPKTGGTATALYTGILGNQITITISQGASSTLCNVLVSGWNGKATEFYQGLPYTAAFWAAFQAACAGGLSATQGPSQLITFSNAGTVGVLAPALGTFTLSGGLDGRTSVTSAIQLGSSSAVPPTGMYSLVGLNPPIQQFWLVGNTDSTSWATQQTFASNNGFACFIAFPVNTTVSTAITTLATAGVLNYEMIPILDWTLIFDSINNVQRLVPPLGSAGGRITALSPEQSPLNKQINGIIGTPRTIAGAPYSYAEIGAANTAGITLISNPIPLGNTFGFRTAVNSSYASNPATGPIEYSRLTNFLLLSVGQALGVYEGQLQSTSAADPVRASVSALLNTFFNNLVQNGQLNSYKVTCDLTNNTPATIAQHILRVDVQARYLSSVWYLVFTLQGGVTVQIAQAVVQSSALATPSVT